MKLIDTNVILRFLVHDNEEMYRAVKDLFKRIDSQEEKVEVKICVLFEVVYVLNGYYERTRNEIRDILILFFQSKGIYIRKKNVVLLTLQLFAENSFDFVDCYLAAELKLGNVKEIYTFDKDLKKLGVAAIKP